MNTTRGIILGIAVSAALAGCGNSLTAQQATTSRQPTLAQICAKHPGDLGTLAGTLVTFKMAMATGDTSSLSSGALDTTSAIDDLENASVGATSANVPAMRAFLQDLQDLSDSVNTPPKYGTAYTGDQTVKKIRTDAKAAGCSIGG